MLGEEYRESGFSLAIKELVLLEEQEEPETPLLDAKNIEEQFKKG